MMPDHESFDGDQAQVTEAALEPTNPAPEPDVTSVMSEAEPAGSPWAASSSGPSWWEAPPTTTTAAMSGAPVTGQLPPPAMVEPVSGAESPYVIDAALAPATGDGAGNAGGQRSGLKAGLIGGLVGAVVAAVVSFGVVTIKDDNASTTQSAAVPTTVAGSGAAATTLDIRALLAKVQPSVVAILTGQGGRSGTGVYTGAGSGVIIDADGLVLTNAHVVSGADVITVKMFDGKEHKATLIGSSSADDVALVKMDGVSGLSPATLGDSTKLQVGDPVIAIGNALNLEGTPTVTQGIVSAKDRSISAQDVSLSNLIQTDAAINPGNSGGPLLNSAGEVVGINTARIPNSQNLGFALDINHVKDVIASIKAGGSGATPLAGGAFLGVEAISVSDLTQAQLDQYGVKVTAGAVVTTISPGTAAEAAGLKPGDVITELGGKPVRTVAELRSTIATFKPGDKVTVKVVRDGETTSVEATLGTRPATAG